LSKITFLELDLGQHLTKTSAHNKSIGGLKGFRGCEFMLS
jgi:hypothetical protein